MTHAFVRSEATPFVRFWSKVLVDHSDKCWEWQAGKQHPGLPYGAFWLNSQNMPAHRYAWELERGPVAIGLNVLHSCDNPKCVNVAHLFLGTDQQNMNDKHNKRRGRGHYGAQKLTPEKVREIMSSELRNIVLAVKYGVSASLICNIKKRRAWRHIRG